MVIGAGTSLSVLEVVDAVRDGHRRRPVGAPRPGQAGRDAGGDRRPEPRARRRLGAALHLRGGPRGRLGRVVAVDLEAVPRAPGAPGVPAQASERPMSLTQPPSRSPSRPSSPSSSRRARRGAAFLAANPAGAGAPLAIVIPAYNEEPTVAEVIAEIPAEAAGLATEVIVVVDGAKDATADRGARGRRARVRRPGQPRPGRGAAARLLAGAGARRPGHRDDRRRRPVRARGDRPRGRSRSSTARPTSSPARAGSAPS